MQAGLSIEDCFVCLKLHRWALRRLREVFIKRLTAEPIYGLKKGVQPARLLLPRRRRRAARPRRRDAQTAPRARRRPLFHRARPHAEDRQTL